MVRGGSLMRCWEGYDVLAKWWWLGMQPGIVFGYSCQGFMSKMDSLKGFPAIVMVLQFLTDYYSYNSLNYWKNIGIILDNSVVIFFWSSTNQRRLERFLLDIKLIICRSDQRGWAGFRICSKTLFIVPVAARSVFWRCNKNVLLR